MAGPGLPPLPAVGRALPLPPAGHEAILVPGGEAPGTAGGGGGGGAGAPPGPRHGAAPGGGGGGGQAACHLRAERPAGERRARLLPAAAPGRPPQEGRAGRGRCVVCVCEGGEAPAVSRQAELRVTRLLGSPCRPGLWPVVRLGRCGSSRC